MTEGAVPGQGSEGQGLEGLGTGSGWAECSLWACLCAAGGVTLVQAPVSLLYHLPLAPVHNVSGNASRGGGVAVGYREACLSNVTAVAEVADMAGLEVRPALPCPCPYRCR